MDQGGAVGRWQLAGPHSAQVSIQVLLHSYSWPWMQPLVLQGTHNCPLLLLLVGPSTKRQQLRMTSKGAMEMEERATAS